MDGFHNDVFYNSPEDYLYGLNDQIWKMDIVLGTSIGISAMMPT
jgi:esterase/lipase superfamily enzyme